jgi:hypothetical protein
MFYSIGTLRDGSEWVGKDLCQSDAVRLLPLTFDEAIKAIINVDPEKVGIVKKPRKVRRKKPKVTPSAEGT